MTKVVTFGEILLRLSPSGHNRFMQDGRFDASFGGAEANVAVSLANFGEKVSFVTKLPKDAIGDACIADLRSFDVDVNSIAFGGDRMGIYFYEKGASVRPSLILYDRKGSAFSEINKSDFDFEKIFDGADWFHFTGITPALSKNVVEVLEDAISVAKKKGIKISCDLNYRSKLWSKEEAKTVMTKLCKNVDILICNESDANDVFGIAAKDTDIVSGKISNAGYEEVSKKLKETFGFEKVAITLRKSISASVNDWSAMLYDGKESIFSKEYHLDIVDRVGAGDSFAAGLIYGIRKGYDDKKSLEFAVAASALKHTIAGDFNRVKVNEVEKLMNGDASGRVAR